MQNTSSYYPYLPKGSSLDSFKTVASAYEQDFNSVLYADIISGSYPYSASITNTFLSQTNSDRYLQERRYIYALKNVLESYTHYSNHYSYSSSFGDKSKQDINTIYIPSIFFGSSIDKGSVELGFFITGTLIGKLQDLSKRGELIETTGSNTGSVAGVVLYNEGIILLTGSWNLDNNNSETYIYGETNIIDNPKWIYWGAGSNKRGSNNLTVSSSFSLNFEGINYIPTITMMAHAEKGDLNHSNNPTYIKYGELDGKMPISGAHGYQEYVFTNIKNTIQYPYDNFTGSLEKQTYISKIGIYDEKKNLIAIAKVSKPIRKPENRDLTFKLKLDI